MTTWHDIADQLTPEQIDLLRWLEGDPLNGLLAKLHRQQFSTTQTPLDEVVQAHFEEAQVG